MPIRDLFRQARPDDPAELEAFLHGQAAFVAQKTVLDYCRVKMGRNDKRYFADADFQAALEHCRWQVFFAATADVMLLAEAALRPFAVGSEAKLGLALGRMHGRALNRVACPAGEAAAAADAAAAFAHQLRAWQDEDPTAPNRMALLAEPVLFATLPIHAEQRVGEALAIRGALRFHMVSAGQELERGFDLAGSARRLVQTAPGLPENEVFDIRP